MQMTMAAKERIGKREGYADNENVPGQLSASIQKRKIRFKVP